MARVLFLRHLLVDKVPHVDEWSIVLADLHGVAEEGECIEVKLFQGLLAGV